MCIFPFLLRGYPSQDSYFPCSWMISKSFSRSQKSLHEVSGMSPTRTAVAVPTSFRRRTLAYKVFHLHLHHLLGDNWSTQALAESCKLCSPPLLFVPQKPFDCNHCAVLDQIFFTGTKRIQSELPLLLDVLLSLAPMPVFIWKEHPDNWNRQERSDARQRRRLAGRGNWSHKACSWSH